ncbi:hypothetical protein FB45DRAFT_861268 [Roridomyces roridus]|uniref:Uncharacterized protein n=1 Tax=Roridomyces roridus TaxID=1738132 RepID=A0AAD7CA46_9AGAR|nr:hypothetical protein FB45DRAFT_861268 [Roridomyces roridus]
MDVRAAAWRWRCQRGYCCCGIDQFEALGLPPANVVNVLHRPNYDGANVAQATGVASSRIGSGTSIECCEYSRHFTREYEYSYSRVGGGCATRASASIGFQKPWYSRVFAWLPHYMFIRRNNNEAPQPTDQWASDLDLIAVDEFEKQLAEGWTQNKKWKAPAAAEASGSVRVIVIDDDNFYQIACGPKQARTSLKKAKQARKLTSLQVYVQNPQGWPFEFPGHKKFVTSLTRTWELRYKATSRNKGQRLKQGHDDGRCYDLSIVNGPSPRSLGNGDSFLTDLVQSEKKVEDCRPDRQHWKEKHTKLNRTTVYSTDDERDVYDRTGRSKPAGLHQGGLLIMPGIHEFSRLNSPRQVFQVVSTESLPATSTLFVQVPAG